MARRGKGLLDCVDCELGSRNEYYTVTDATWQAAGSLDGCLCVGCLEHRLGRELAIHAFTDAPLNREGERGYRSRRLRARLGLGGT